MVVVFLERYDTQNNFSILPQSYVVNNLNQSFAILQLQKYISWEYILKCWIFTSLLHDLNKFSALHAANIIIIASKRSSWCDHLKKFETYFKRFSWKIYSYKLIYRIEILFLAIRLSNQFSVKSWNLSNKKNFCSTAMFTIQFYIPFLSLRCWVIDRKSVKSNKIFHSQTVNCSQGAISFRGLCASYIFFVLSPSRPHAIL